LFLAPDSHSFKPNHLISDIPQTEQNQRQLGAVEGIGDYWAAAFEAAARF
jgi:hypothetical protein